MHSVGAAWLAQLKEALTLDFGVMLSLELMKKRKKNAYVWKHIEGQ